MGEGFVAGAAVWTPAPADTNEAYLLATIKSVEDDGKTCVCSGEGPDRTLKTAELVLANPPGLSAPDNAYLIHISEGEPPPTSNVASAPPPTLHKLPPPSELKPVPSAPPRCAWQRPFLPTCVRGSPRI